jgi:hypothetical protein
MARFPFPWLLARECGHLAKVNYSMRYHQVVDGFLAVGLIAQIDPAPKLEPRSGRDASGQRADVESDLAVPSQISGGTALSSDEHASAWRCHDQALLAKHRDSRADRVLGKPGLRHEFMNRRQSVAALQLSRADEAAEFVGELSVCRNLAQAIDLDAHVGHGRSITITRHS